jgi:MFS family permease
MEKSARTGAGYQILLVGLLSLTFGVVFFDRNAFSFLTPFVQPELSLTNTQVGLIGSAMSLTWALSGLIIGAASDRAGKRKVFLVAATVLFSLCSFLTGLATSFAMLLGARLLMGAAEGSILPISQSLIALEVSEKRRGVAMGAVQTTGAALLGSFLAPIILVALAESFGWRNAFYLAGVPGLFCAALIWATVREPVRPVASAAAQQRVRLADVLADRNIIICTGIAVLLVAFMLITWAFMPLYLTSIGGFSPTTMSWLISMLGLAAATFGIGVPALSDRIGRKPVMVAVPLLGVLIPLAALFGGSAVPILAAAFFLGWAFAGTFALFMAIVPSETVPAPYLATAMGFVIAVGEAVGGVGGPLLAGVAADRFGLGVVNWILLGLCLCASALALLLRETAPAVVAKRAAVRLAAAA